ncbi:MAG: inositol monophosphatase family protein [Candidatus Hermodarchaeota archaeon]
MLSDEIQRFWYRHLRNAAALARLRVLSCLKTGSCQEEIGTGAGGDVTKKFDLVAEQTMIEYLMNFSSFTLVSEEAGMQKVGANPNGFLIMDPIDGSTNVSHGISFACISVAYATELEFDSIEVAVVLDLFSGTCYHASRNKGSFRDTHKIRPAEPTPLKTSLVGFDSSFPANQKEFQNSDEPQIRYTRHLGANALELCYVADGSLDGFIDLRSVFRGTDLAAAALILREAGAVLIDRYGRNIVGKCTNDEHYDYIAARDVDFAQTLVKLVSGAATG